MSNIHLFFGPDTYRSLAKLNDWKKAFVKKYGEGTVREVIPDQENFKVSPLLGGPSLFSATTLLIVRDPFSADSGKVDPDDLQDLIDKGLSDGSYLVLWQRGSLDKRLTQTKKLQEQGKSGKINIQEFEYLTEENALKFLAQEFAKAGLKLKRDAGQLLAEYLSADQGLNSWSAVNSVAQLAAYCSRREVVTIEDVRQLVAPLETEDAFLPLLKSFANKDKRGLARNLDILVKQAQTDQELLGLIGALFESTKNMLLVLTLKQNGLSLDQIDEALGFKKGRSKYVSADAAKFSVGQLHDLLETLLDLEFDIKQGKTVLAPALSSVLQSI